MEFRLESIVEYTVAIQKIIELKYWFDEYYYPTICSISTKSLKYIS